MTNVNGKPLWIRLVCFLLSFAIVLYCTSWESAHTNAYMSSAISVNLIDRNGTEHTDPVTDYGLSFDFSGLMRNGSVLSEGDQLLDGDELSFVMSWDAGRFDSGAQDASGKFTIKFNNLKCANVDLNNLSKPGVEGIGCFASYSMSPSDGILSIEVTPNGKNNNFKGFCTVSLKVNVDRSTLGAGNTLRLEKLSDLTFTYAPGSVEASKSRMGGIYKSGDKYYQNFSIDLTHTGSSVSNVKVTDTCGSIFKDLTSSMPTFRLTDASFTDSLPNTGDVISGTAIGANSFELNFDSLNESKRIVYALEIDPANVAAALEAAKSGDRSSIRNDLKVNYNDGYENKEKVAPSVELDVTQPSVTKRGSLDRDNNKINWVIEFYPGTLGTFINPISGDLIITDTPDGTNLTLDALKAGLTAASINYTEASGGLTISGAYLTGTSAPYTLSYSTAVAPEQLENTTVKNFTNNVSATFDVVTSGPASAYVPVGKDAEPGTAHKTVVSGDPNTFDIEWKSDITIPADGGTTHHIVIEDDSRNRWDATYGNVVIPAYLSTDINGFTFRIDGVDADISSYITDLKYFELDKTDQWGNCSEKDTFAADSDVGFKFTLNNSFVSANVGKTLSIIYHTVMGGDLSGHYSEAEKGSLKYTNKITAHYKESNDNTINSPSETAEYQYQADVTAQKCTKDGYNPGIVADYPGGDHPVLAFWEIRVHKEEGFAANDVITIRDTVSAGHSYYAGSAVLVAGGYAVGDRYNMTNNDDWRTKYTTNITNIETNGTETVFTITIDDTLAAAANAEGKNVINLLYATAANEEISSDILFGKTVTVNNTAEVSVNSVTVSGLGASQKLSSNSEVMKKTIDSVVKGEETSKYGDASYTLVVNKYGQTLSSNGKIIVDDWLGGSLELPTTVTVAKQKLVGGELENDGDPIVYTVDKNQYYDSDDINSIHSFFKKDGVIVPESVGAVYKTGVGKKMTFHLDDGTAYKITYTLKYEKLVSAFSLSSVEEAARYNNTAVIRTEGGNSNSDTVSITSDNYKVTAGVSAGTMENYIIFDIRKKWVGDSGGLGRPDSITLHVRKTNLNDNSVEDSDITLTLHENAVEQEDGSWLFALKLPALTINGSEVTRYSYTISEANLAGYTASWSTQLSDVSLANNETGKVVSSELTNTSAMRFAVKKTDINGLNELVGAHLAIYKASDIGTDGRPTASAIPSDSWTSDGSTHYSSLADGDYVLLETGTDFADSATGKTYKITESAVSFTVSGNYISNVSGNHIGTVTAADSASGFIKYTAASGNTPAEFRVCDAESETTPASLKVSKYNITTGTEVTGATIQIYNASDMSGGNPLPGAAPVHSWVSEAGGHTFALADGEYVLIESGDKFNDTVTGKHYKVTDSIFTFTVFGGAITAAEVIDSGSANGSMTYTADTASLSVNDVELNKTVIKKTDMAGTAIPAGNPATFVLKAVSAGLNLDGVVIGGTTYTTTDTQVTFSGNDVTITNLKNGNYTLEETVAPTGYKTVSEFTFTITDGVVTAVDVPVTSGAVVLNDDGSITVKDAAQNSVVIYKTDAAGNQLAGAVLSITDNNGNAISGIDDYTTVTDSKWEITGLAPGTYHITEKTAPDGFVKLTDTVDIVVDTNGIVTSVAGNGGTLTASEEVRISNVKSTLSINKTDMSGTDIPAGNNASFILTITEVGKNLKGVEVGGTTLGNVKSYSFIGNSTEFAGLKDGTYTLEETAAPDGYKVVTKFTFTVQAGKVISVDSTITSGSAEADANGNLVVKDDVASLTIDKTDMTGNAISAGNNATFKLTITETGKTLEGVKVGDTILGNVTDCTFTGNSTAISGLKNGSYTLEETVAPDGYETVSTFGFTIGNGKVTGITGTITSGAVDYSTEGRLIVKDETVKPKITIKKTDITGDNELYGAVLQLLDENDNAIGDAHTSNSTSAWEVGPLAAGTYKIRETTAPDRYKKITTAVTFTVGDDGKVISVGEGGIRQDDTTVLVKNELSVITINKTDMAGNAIPNTNKATFVLTITEQGKDLKGVKVGDTVLGEVTSVEIVSNDITLTGLPDGSYTLEESVAPNGYLAVSTFAFSVEDGIVKSLTKPVTTGDIVRTHNGNLIIKDAAEGDNNVENVISIKKTDMSGSPISASNKAKFRLTANGGLTLAGVKMGETVLGAVTSISFEGNDTKFTGLADGSYTLEETAAPEGYLTVSSFNFTVNNGAVNNITGVFTSGDAVFTADGITVKDERKQPTVNPPVVIVTTTPVNTSAPVDQTNPAGTTASATNDNPEDTTVPVDQINPEDTASPEDTPDITDTTTTPPITDDSNEDTKDSTVPSNTDTETNRASGSSHTSDDNPHTDTGSLALALVPETVLIVVFRRKKNKK